MLFRSRRRPPNITCTQNIHAMRVDLITNGYSAIVCNRSQKNIYITTTTPMSQDTKEYNTKIQITAESGIVSEYGQESNGLRVLKVNDGVHFLPRPSRKGNLANVVKHKPTIKTTRAKKKKTKERVSTKGILSEARQSAAHAGWLVELSGSKHELK